jgi:hypothetical protein
MTFVVPWGLIAIFIAFYIFYERIRLRRLKKEEREEELNNRRQEMISRLRKSKDKTRGGPE